MPPSHSCMTLTLLACLLLQQSPTLDTTRVRAVARGPRRHPHPGPRASRESLPLHDAGPVRQRPRQHRAEPPAHARAPRSSSSSSASPRSLVTVTPASAPGAIPRPSSTSSPSPSTPSATASASAPRPHAHADLARRHASSPSAASPSTVHSPAFAPSSSRDNEMGVLARAPMLLAMPEVLLRHRSGTRSRHATLTLDTPKGRRDVTLTPVGLFPMLTGETRPHLDAPRRLGRCPRQGAAHRSGSAMRATCTGIAGSPSPAPSTSSSTPFCRRRDDSLAVFLARAIHAADSAGAERFVLDLRLNGGGNGEWNRDILRSPHQVPVRCAGPPLCHHRSPHLLRGPDARL